MSVCSINLHICTQFNFLFAHVIVYLSNGILCVRVHKHPHSLLMSLSLHFRWSTTC